MEKKESIVKIFSGKVEYGKQLGRTIQFPTANIQVKREYMPKKGVYAVYVYVNGQQFIGMMNVGTRPTIADGNHETVEVHILDFYEMIYGQIIVVEVIAAIREERKFSSVQALQVQLQKDKQYTMRIVQQLVVDGIA